MSTPPAKPPASVFAVAAEPPATPAPAVNRDSAMFEPMLHRGRTIFRFLPSGEYALAPDRTAPRFGHPDLLPGAPADE